MRDLYDILEVEEKADARTLKKAYRAKALEFHPDVNSAPNAEMQFLEVQEAYLILSDPKKRAIYDRGFELPEVELPTRDRYPPPHIYRKRRSLFDEAGTARSIKIDHNEYAGLARNIGIVTFLFAFTFLIDSIFHKEIPNLTITSLQTKAQVTKRPDDVRLVIVKAGDQVFEKRRDTENELIIGETIDIRKSIIYGYVDYRRNDEERYRSVSILVNIVHFTALMVYIASLSAIFIRKHPETKFNAALIAAFFALALLAFVILTG